jgi:hypothetical protein
MSQRLISLVQADPILMIYALEHLQDNVPINQAHMFYASMLRTAVQQISAQLLLVLIGKHPRHRLTPEHTARLEKIWEQRAENIVDLVQTTERLQGISIALRDADLATIRSQLRDVNSIIRPVVIQIIAQRRLPLEGDLIELLSDPNARSAAHDGLVRLARGTDFGPFPGASTRGIERSIEKWKHWLALQRSASPQVLAEKAAIAAAGKKIKPAPLEVVPLILVGDEQGERQDRQK